MCCCVSRVHFYFCLKVAWEIQTASASLISINDNAYDLFLLGSKMSGVDSRPDLRRLNTETYVYCFYGTNNGKAMKLRYTLTLSRGERAMFHTIH